MGGGTVTIGPAPDPALHGWRAPREAGGAVTGRVYVPVADAGSRHAAAAGCAALGAPAGRDRGGRGRVASDPEGDLWPFGTCDPWAAGA